MKKLQNKKTDMNPQIIVWLDLRFIKINDPYSSFVIELINFIIRSKKDFFYNIYINKDIERLFEKNNNVKIFKIKSKVSSFKDQIFFKDKTQNEDLFIFFDWRVPINIKKKYIVFIPDLAELHFLPKLSFIQKAIKNYIFTSSCKKAKNIVCFNDILSEEINDKLNIREDKIKVIKAFFKKYEQIDKDEEININIKTRYGIEWEYLIYDWWNSLEKWLDKLIDVFEKIREQKLDISLLILDTQTIKDIEFRKKVLAKNLNERIFFIWEVNRFETKYFYKNSLGVIYPVLYSIFPFFMEKSLNYNCNILSSNLKTIKDIFWDNIGYFNPNISDTILKSITKLKKKKNNYSKILEREWFDKSCETLIELIY